MNSSMKIIRLVGKSGCGKDTVYSRVMEKYDDSILKRVVSCTTRPMRVGEVTEASIISFHMMIS